MRRDMNTQVATERTSLRQPPGGRNVKKDQAWKYPGNTIERAGSILLNGRFYTDPKEEPFESNRQHQGRDLTDTPNAPLEGTPRRKQETHLFITINTNHSYPDAALSTAKAIFHTALLDLKTNVEGYLKFGPMNAFYQNDKASDVILKPIGWEAEVETGETLRRLHCHITLNINHYSQIQVSAPLLAHKFREAFNNAAGGSSSPFYLSKPPYINIAKPLPQKQWESTLLRQYMRKELLR